MIEKPLLAFGEVLWDIFPDGKRLGGAPLNFSYYFQRAGGSPKIVSSVGEDALGNETLNKIRSLGLDNSYISQLSIPTGRVNISFEQQEHRFDILRGTAWENIPHPGNELVSNSLGIYFGTVARISQGNRRTLDRLIDGIGEGIIFLDLNLRPDFFYDPEDVNHLLVKCNYLKLNGAEADILRVERFAKDHTEEEMIYSLIRRYGLKACAITLGENGAVGGNENGIFRVGGIKAKSGGDTVGCGDAFAGVWLASLLKGMSQEESLCRANEVASRVASKRGAIVEI